MIFLETIGQGLFVLGVGIVRLPCLRPRRRRDLVLLIICSVICFVAALSILIPITAGSTGFNQVWRVLFLAAIGVICPLSLALGVRDMTQEQKRKT